MIDPATTKLPALNLPQGIEQAIYGLTSLLQSAGADRLDTEAFIHLCKAHLSQLSDKEKSIAEQQLVSRICEVSDKSLSHIEQNTINEAKLKGKDFI